MTTEVQTTPPSAPASTPVACTPVLKLTPLVRLLLMAMARSNRAMTLMEIERNTPCSHASASILTRRLETYGLLKSFASEFGVPKTYDFNRAAFPPAFAILLDEPWVALPVVAHD